jgi:ankyrin repeat protein
MAYDIQVIKSAITDNLHGILHDALNGGLYPDSIDEDGFNLLFLAIEAENTEAADMLLRFGATGHQYFCQTSYHGKTPLVHAIEKGLESIAHLLISHLQENKQNLIVPPVGPHDEEINPLEAAAGKGMITVINRLLDQGLEVNSRVISAAITYNRDNQCLPLLVEHCDATQLTHSHLAMALNAERPEYYSLLLASGAEVQSDSRGKSAFYYAIEMQNLDAIQVLVRAGANPNARYRRQASNEVYDTPMMQLCRIKAKSKVEKAFISQSIATLSQAGYTFSIPAMYIHQSVDIRQWVRKQKTEYINLPLPQYWLRCDDGLEDRLCSLAAMLENGLDPDLTDSNGQTLLSYLFSLKKKPHASLNIAPIIDLLVAHGAWIPGVNHGYLTGEQDIIRERGKVIDHGISPDHIFSLEHLSIIFGMSAAVRFNPRLCIEREQLSPETAKMISSLDDLFEHTVCETREEYHQIATALEANDAIMFIKDLQAAYPRWNDETDTGQQVIFNDLIGKLSQNPQAIPRLFVTGAKNIQVMTRYYSVEKLIDIALNHPGASAVIAEFACLMSQDDPQALIRDEPAHDDLAWILARKHLFDKESRAAKLIIAILERRKADAWDLLRAGADLSYQGPAGISALSAAMRHGFDPLVKGIIKKATPDDLDVTDCLGQTALHYAIIQGYDDYRDLLLKAGAKTDIPDQSGMTAAMLQLRRDNPAMFQSQAG